MGWQIGERDKPWVARLKLVYLLPLFILLLIPCCLIVGWLEYGRHGFQFAWQILKTGRP